MSPVHPPPAGAISGKPSILPAGTTNQTNTNQALALQKQSLPSTLVARSPQPQPTSVIEVKIHSAGLTHPTSPDKLAEQGQLADKKQENCQCDQLLSEEAKLQRNSMEFYINWHHIPTFDHASSATEDNPFVCSRPQPTGKISVTLPANDWLCKNWRD